MNKPELSLEFLIPTYRRLDSAVAAARSILEQIHLLPPEVRLSIRLQDDASPGLSDAEFERQTSALPETVQRGRNSKNLGMSSNIHALISTCKADFCTILSDDDSLQPGVLGEIAQELLGLLSPSGEFEAAALFVPRHSYLEDGSLYCVVCAPFDQDTLISPSPAAAVEHADNGFVLTGLFLKPEKLPYPLWKAHFENAFFPVIYLGGLLLEQPVAYRKRRWFHHTVLNLCHWERWGDTDRQRQFRLCHDYLEALQVLRRRSLARCTSPGERKRVHSLASQAYRRQIDGYSQYLPLATLMQAVPRSLWLESDFLQAFRPFLLRSLGSFASRRGLLRRGGEG